MKKTLNIHVSFIDDNTDERRTFEEVKTLCFGETGNLVVIMKNEEVKTIDCDIVDDIKMEIVTNYLN